MTGESRNLGYQKGEFSFSEIDIFHCMQRQVDYIAHSKNKPAIGWIFWQRGHHYSI
jgi:hypothetical protein